MTELPGNLLYLHFLSLLLSIENYFVFKYGMILLMIDVFHVSVSKSQSCGADFITLLTKQLNTFKKVGCKIVCMRKIVMNDPKNGTKNYFKNRKYS